ncbi:hypothetical protein N7541_011873 [Penicillium brevicompactum]|uniref:DNA2/NAM7 helicase-like C-terminal domain-containing protein n=1 Tax=Penicillium brevicompactum TaxID=5074 RepID=A0A9W9QU89_PENBR|nr:hypothetical protein N7541_011873 [Penicillium brevicompactum]
MVVDWGAILEQQVEAKVNGSGFMFLGKMQVYSVDRDDEYLAIIDLQPPDEADPDAPKRLQTGTRLNVKLAKQELKDEREDRRDRALNTWCATVVPPVSFCPIQYWTVILRRPSDESLDAIQPRVIPLPRYQTSFSETDVESEYWDAISYQLQISKKPYDRFLSVNEDLVIKPVNKLIMDTLLGTNPSLLPIRNALAGITQEHMQRVRDNIIVSDDFDLLLENVSAMHGPLYTVEGPAGTGKSHALLALALMDLGGANFKYPVHSQDFPGEEWCALFNDWQESKEDTEPINVYNENASRQVVIIAATNSVANDMTIKASDMFRKIFPDSQPRIIRVHAVHIEKQVVENASFKKANQSSTDPSGKSKSSGHTKRPPDRKMPECDEAEDIAMLAGLRTATEFVNELIEHYALTKPDILSPWEGVSDPRLKEITTSLGAAMLGVAGHIPGSPWANLGLGPYHDFDAFWKERKTGIDQTDEAKFQKACRLMKRDVLKTAHMVIGKPAMITEPTILTCLHPSFVAVDEASMIRETELHAAFAWLYPISFGLFGDSRQLGPHSSSGKSENPFYKQVQMSLLERMSTAGYMATFLTHQRRMMGAIQRLSREIFYHDKEMKNAVSDSENKGRRSTQMLDVPWATEERIDTSFANAGNRAVVLDLVRKLVRDGLAEAKDIVVLVGYEAQWRQYIKDLHALARTDPTVAWNSVRPFNIDAIQGNEADIVIFDFVRCGRQRGFMGDARRMNVACSRGRFGFYLVASASTLKGRGLFSYETYARVLQFFEGWKAEVTIEKPARVTASDEDD